MAKASFVRYVPTPGAEPIVLKISGKFDPFTVNETVATLLFPIETPEQLASAARADAIMKRRAAA